MAILVIAEHDHKQIKDATLKTITAARALGGDMDVLVLGSDCSTVVEAAKKIEGVRKVLAGDNPAYAHFLAEALAPVVAGIAKNYSHVLAPATSFGKDFMPRAAALLDVAPLSDVIAILSEDTFKRPIYAGNAIVTVQSKDAVRLLTVRTSAFSASSREGGNATVENVTISPENTLSHFVSKEENLSERPELTSARVVISGGRGLGSKENFHLLDGVAKKLNAAIGASRAAVDAGFAPNDYQVGQTGKIVAPELYIAVGISGAIQHLAGMKDSKIIVAINKDENAPIFEVADYGVVMDLFQALPELEKLL